MYILSNFQVGPMDTHVLSVQGRWSNQMPRVPQSLTPSPTRVL